MNKLRRLLISSLALSAMMPSWLAPAHNLSFGPVNHHRRTRRSWYMPHQGKREKERRLRQLGAL